MSKILFFINTRKADKVGIIIMECKIINMNCPVFAVFNYEYTRVLMLPQMLIKITHEETAKKIISIFSRLLEIQEAFPKQYLLLLITGAMIFYFVCFTGIHAKTAFFYVAKTGLKFSSLPERKLILILRWYFSLCVPECF